MYSEDLGFLLFESPPNLHFTPNLHFLDLFLPLLYLTPWIFSMTLFIAVNALGGSEYPCQRTIPTLSQLLKLSYLEKSILVNSSLIGH